MHCHLPTSIHFCLLILREEHQQHDSDVNVKDETGDTGARTLTHSYTLTDFNEDSPSPQAVPYKQLCFLKIVFHWTVVSVEAVRKQRESERRECRILQ